MKKGLDAYKLKLIALLFMITDHVYSYLNAPVHGYQAGASWPQWIPVLTRFVSPLFLYLMIDGFYHTSSRKKISDKDLHCGHDHGGRKRCDQPAVP